jgi:hypothetical protein
VILEAGSTATTELVRAFGLIVRSRRSVDGVGFVIDMVEVMAALDDFSGDVVVMQIRFDYLEQVRAQRNKRRKNKRAVLKWQIIPKRSSNTKRQYPG